MPHLKNNINSLKTLGNLYSYCWDGCWEQETLILTHIFSDDKLCAIGNSSISHLSKRHYYLPYLTHCTIKSMRWDHIYYLDMQKRQNIIFTTNARNHNLHHRQENLINLSIRFQTNSTYILIKNAKKLRLLQAHGYKIAHTRNWLVKLTNTISNWLQRPTILQYVFMIVNKKVLL